MKAILVIDMPKTCFGCPCYSFNAQAKRFECDAKLYLKGKIGVVELDKKPSWCPLKPLKLGDELCKFRNTIKDKNTLIGFNMAVAICNKYLGEEE